MGVAFSILSLFLIFQPVQAYENSHISSNEFLRPSVERGISLLFEGTSDQNLTSLDRKKLVNRAFQFKKSYDSLLRKYKLTGFQSEKVGRHLTRFEFDSPLKDPERAYLDKVSGYFYFPEEPYGCKLQYSGTLFIHHVADSIQEEKLVASHVAHVQRGATMLIFLPEYGPRKKADSKSSPIPEKVSDFKKQILRILLEVRVAGEILKSHPQINRIQLGGLSLGGMIAPISAGIDPFFDEYLLALGGGDIASVITEKKKTTDGVIHRSLKNIRWKTNETRKFLSDLDAISWAYTVKGKEITIINHLRDELIDPYLSFGKLKKAYEENNDVRIHQFDASHIPTPETIGWWNTAKIYLKFLRKWVLFHGDLQDEALFKCREPYLN